MPFRSLFPSLPHALSDDFILGRAAFLRGKEHGNHNEQNSQGHSPGDRLSVPSDKSRIQLDPELSQMMVSCFHPSFWNGWYFEGKHADGGPSVWWSCTCRFFCGGEGNQALNTLFRFLLFLFWCHIHILGTRTLPCQTLRAQKGWWH